MEKRDFIVLILIIGIFFTLSYVFFIKDWLAYSEFSINPNVLSNKNPKNIPTIQDPFGGSQSQDSDSSIFASSSSIGADGSDGENQESIDPLLEPHYCTLESRDVECDESQNVVCGWFIRQDGVCNGPCVKIFVNTCQACEDDRIEYWTLGDCPIHG